MNKQGQVTIFVIMAVLIIGGIIAYFMIRDRFVVNSIPEEFRPVYDYYLSCLEDSTQEGINLLGEQGGYIEVPDFEPGSSYMPFSNQLDFLGQGVPYWMYVSGNNLLKEQVPTKKGMERELGDYVSNKIVDCDFTDFVLAGYDVYIEEGEAVVIINNLDVGVDVKNKVTMFKGNSSVIIENHKLEIPSKLGKFYDLAIGVYNLEKSNVFLEEYAIDVMRLYAPVDGTEISCVPKIFNKEEIRIDIVEGLSANIATLKVNGDYYDLSSAKRNYFVVDGLNVDENVNFMYSPEWPTRVEMYGDLVAQPVGLQEGLGILGFCYVPYHFVYDINFPVMVQFYDTENFFQFPVAVIIDKSLPRGVLPTTSGSLIESRVCEYKNQDVEIRTYDVDLNPVKAQISFKCLDAVCQIGDTEFSEGDAVLEGKFPSCVNGFITARAKGYLDSKFQISTNEESSANIIMDKKYELGLDLGNVEKALVTFSSEDYSTSVLYPDVTSIELVEGFYNVSVYAYDNSSLVFPETNERRCVDVPADGISGLFGAEAEKCFDINLPATEISFAVVGGGRTTEYITVVDLENSVELNINVPLFGLPLSLEELQENNLAVEDEVIYLSFE